MSENQHRHIPQVVLLVLFAVLLSGGTSTALSRRSLRVMTYNIHVGVGMDKQLDLQRIADVINKERPDLVALQEVDRGVERTQRKDEIVELARLTHMEYAFAHNLDYQGGQYGVAILSRYPIRTTDHRMYQNKREAERRGMIRIEAKIGGKLVNFVTTHLDYQFQDGRLFEAEQLVEFLRDVKGPLILAGDFNDEPTGTAYKLMLTQFDDTWLSSRQKASGFTYPADKPIKRIDYILIRKSDRLRARKSSVVETLASDHIPVLTEIELR
ncbi:MAG TPA: endonuclease/exonuclease/phosphatase family protein [Pyrinomonadaceae bacterium]|jgi:endonuclease/exonuclease/phosphatase family metal-dependent hydrolase